MATTLDLPMVGASMAVDSPLAVAMEVLPLEGPMDTPVLGDSHLELRVDHMVVYLQGAPTVSHLQVPMVPSSLGLMDRVSSTFGSGTQCRTFRPDLSIRVPSVSFLKMCTYPGLWLELLTSCFAILAE